MKIVSWNINSLRLRLPLLKKFVDNFAPDIICLQEIKVANNDFPIAEIKALGFDYVEFDGEKSYNGVAILSKLPVIEIVKMDVLNYGHKRHIGVALETAIGKVFLHNFYVPAGGDIPDPILNNKFDHKLKFVDWMADYFASHHDEKIIILGDFNIAPAPQDVWSHRQLLQVVSHTPIEVEKLNKLQQSRNFIDTHRQIFGEAEKLYSWWSYRALEPFKSNRGRRLDHLWITPNLGQYLVDAKIYKEWRLESSPSDHVPIEVLLKIS